MMEGTLRTGERIRMMATGAEFEVVECGCLRPLGLEATGLLEAGQVGYLTASIKSVEDTRVGDTVTLCAQPCEAPLPGYKPCTPMVFSGIYPADGARYEDLREALAKLKLNDASFLFEPETSVALGFGFRCGFLGLLHMEVIQERIEREFQIDIITTAPSVSYRVLKTNGTVLQIDNPTNYPDPAEIASTEEPFVRADIISPKEFVGNIMDLCQDRRGLFKNMSYIDSDRVNICLLYTSSILSRS